jgi:hypothetical protein
MARFRLGTTMHIAMSLSRLQGDAQATVLLVLVYHEPSLRRECGCNVHVGHVLPGLQLREVLEEAPRHDRPSEAGLFPVS